VADTLLDATKLRDYYDISKDIKDARLTPHVGAASRRLKGWVGAGAYADALAQQPQDALRAEDLKNAEAALAMHFALPGINTKITPGGVVTSVKETGSVSAPVVTTYLRPDQVRELAAIYLDQAEEIARPYMLADGTPEAEVEVVTE
jgi:hypothetical protein